MASLLLLALATLGLIGPPQSEDLLARLQSLRHTRGAALRVVAENRPATLALLDRLCDTFDASIHSARTRPEQRKVEYDAALLDTGTWIGRLYADVTRDARPWNRFTARKLRIEGTELLNARQYRAALGKLTAALAEASRLDDVWLKVITQLNLAYARIELDDARAARDLCASAAKDADRLGPRAQALTAFDLGSTYLHLGQFAESIPYSEKAARTAQTIGIRIWEGNALLNLGAAHQQLGDVRRAQSTFEAALAVLMQTQDKLGIGRTLYNLALVSSNQGDDIATADYLERALPLIKDVDLRHSHEIELDPRAYYNPIHEETLRLLGETYTRLNQPAKVAAYQAALSALLKTKPRSQKVERSHAGHGR